MNYFEQELRRLTKVCDGLTNPTFAGRACYGDLGGDNRVKLQFVTNGYADHYDNLKVTIISRTGGEIDNLLFRFKDVWGKKHPHSSMDGTAHIWTNGGKSEWYAYRPTDADMKQLAAEVSGYLSVFIDRALIPEKSKVKTAEKESVTKKIRDAKQKAVSNKDTSPRKKPGLEL